MVGKTLLVTTIASVLAVMLVASIAVSQPIAQAQEEAEDAEPYIANTYPMELPVMPESYPVRVFAKIDGITGGSMRADHEGEIEIRNYFFSTAPDEQSINDVGEFSEVTILKMSDESTPALITAAGDMTEFDTILLSVRDTGASADRVQVLLIDTQLLTLRHTSESDDWYYQPGWTWEETTFSFDKIMVKYQAIDADGNPVGSPTISGWDMKGRQAITDTVWSNYMP